MSGQAPEEQRGEVQAPEEPQVEVQPPEDAPGEVQPTAVELVAEDEPAASGPLAAGVKTLDLNARQGIYGVAYLRTIAAQVGLGITEPGPGADVLAYDATIEYKETGLRVQVKTSRVATMDPTVTEIRYYAKPAWITAWKHNVHPCYFVVVVVPGDSADWLDHDEAGTLMAETAAYWVRIDTAALNESTAIVVSKAQRLTAETLTEWHGDLMAPYGGS